MERKRNDEIDVTDSGAKIGEQVGDLNDGDVDVDVDDDQTDEPD
jgi:hypothetical protein